MYGYSALQEIEAYAEALTESLGRLQYILGIADYVNPPGVYSSRTHEWTALNEEGLKVQRDACWYVSELWTRTQAVADFLPADLHQRLERWPDMARQFARQKEHPFSGGVSEALREAIQEVTDHLELIRKNCFGKPTQTAIFTDTNVLIKAGSFSRIAARYQDGLLVVPSSVVSELDGLKVHHRAEGVRKKADKLIRQLKELRRRGDVLDEVKVEGQVFLRMIAYEPHFEGLPTWLDTAHADDRFLATALDYRRRSALSPVLVCTLDLNLQNKCELARLPFDEPDDEFTPLPQPPP